MNEITMIERLGPKVAIGTDGRQWIVFRADGRENPRPDRAWQGEEWEAVGFIHSDKRTLIKCIAAKELKLSKAGQAALERQEAKIWRWRKPADVHGEAH
jgi:hypothetical protein